MNGFVFDCSVALALFYGDGEPQYMRAVMSLIEEGADLYVPPLWHYELTNGLVTATRRGKADKAEIREFLDRLERLPICFHYPDDWREEFAMTEALTAAAVQHKLTAYDNAYLVLAMRLDVPLATLDQDLKGAAARIGVKDIT